MSHGEYTETKTTAIKAKERLGKLDDFNWSISGQSENIGRMGTNASTGGAITEERRKKEKEENLRAALDQVQRLKELQDIIDGADDGITAGNNLLTVMRNGEFDRDNELHVAWIVALGLDPNDETMTEQDVAERIKELEQIKLDAKREQISIEADTSLTHAEKVDKQATVAQETFKVEAEVIELKGMDLDAFLDDSSTSFASLIEDTPIKASEPLCDAFCRAHDDVQHENVVQPNTAPVIDFSSPT